MAFQTMTARLTRSTSLSDYTKHLEFEVASAPGFGFVPGQWISLQQTKPDQEELTRASRSLLRLMATGSLFA
jgi:hypothetical protein